MQRRDAPCHDRRAVLRRGVAHVRGELPPGVQRVGAVHVAIARDLGDDRGGGDGRAAGVSADHRPLLVPDVADREAVGQAHTAAATSGPARQPRPASSAPATKRTPRSRSKAKSRRAVGRLGRRATMAGIMTEGSAEPPRGGRSREPLEEADATGRPIGGERRADDPLLRDRAPEAAVVGGATIVPHHEVIVLGHQDGAGKVALLPAGAGLDELLRLPLPVADHVAVADRDRVTGHSDYPLDEVHVGASQRRLRARPARDGWYPATVVLGALRRVEDEDVPHLRIGEAGADAVDEHALADLKRRLHGLARNSVGLDQEGLDAERQRERGGDDQDELEQGARGRLLLLLGLGDAHSRSPSPSAGAASSAAASADCALGSPSAVSAPLGFAPPSAFSASALASAAASNSPSRGASSSAGISPSAGGGSSGAWSRPASTTSSAPAARRSRTRARLPTRSRR